MVNELDKLILNTEADPTRVVYNYFNVRNMVKIGKYELSQLGMVNELASLIITAKAGPAWVSNNCFRVCNIVKISK